MPFLGPIDVTIELDGSPLEEYAIKTIANETKVGCHVASQVGKNFAVCIRQLESPAEGYKRMAELIVDGKRTNKTILHGNAVTRITGYRVKKNLRRSFVFAAVPTPAAERAIAGPDTAPATQQPPVAQPNPQSILKLESNSKLLPPKHSILPVPSLGTIKILIATVKLKSKAENPNRKFQPRAGSGTTEWLTDVTRLPDLSGLGGDDSMEVHYTELDEGVNVAHGGGIIAEVATAYPVFQLDYRYAPLAVLQSEGITRFTREGPFSGISILPSGPAPGAHGPGEGLGRAGDWAYDVDTGSELLDENDRVRYRELNWRSLPGGG